MAYELITGYATLCKMRSMSQWSSLLEHDPASILLIGESRKLASMHRCMQQPRSHRLLKAYFPESGLDPLCSSLSEHNMLTCTWPRHYHPRRMCNKIEHIGLGVQGLRRKVVAGIRPPVMLISKPPNADALRPPGIGGSAYRIYEDAK